MRCPNCNQIGYQHPQPCPHCQQVDRASPAEELAHVDWLLAEVETWQPLGSWSRKWVQTKYTGRKKDLEITLGVRLPPFSPDKAGAAWATLFAQENLLSQLAAWQLAGYLKADTGQSIINQTRQEINTCLERLEPYPRPPQSQAGEVKLAAVNRLLDDVERLDQLDIFTNIHSRNHIQNQLLSRQEELELQLGLRPQPEPEPPQAATVPESPIMVNPAEAVVATAATTDTPVAARVGSTKVVAPNSEKVVNPPRPDLPTAPPQPRIPLRERVWQILLSERTLHAMLVLGIFLLFAAAISFVAWGWREFSAPLRVAIPTGFTALFFVMGRFVRIKTRMYRSGIALSAIAALLIPIDFYTVYVNFHIPPNVWPYFWFVTSLISLAAYVMATLTIRNSFFGYLVAAAAGSVVLSLIEIGHQTVGLSLDWRSTGLAVLALGLLMLATSLAAPSTTKQDSNRWSIFVDPFRYLSLLSISVIMLLTFGWRFARHNGYDTFHYAVTANWWLGAFIFGWAAIYYRSRGLGLLAAMALPVATYLAQAAIFAQHGIDPAWHAFGWALLIPLYFAAGYKLLQSSSDPVLCSHGRTALGWGSTLLLIAALWPLANLGNGTAAAASHTVLAVTILFAALLWQRPYYLYGASLLFFSGAMFAMSQMGLTLAQLSIGLSSVAILHIIAAISLGTRFPIPVPTYATPLAQAGYIIAALAVVPTIFPYESAYLSYALGNWLALSAWGSRLAFQQQPGFIDRRIWRKSTFHWFTAGPLPFWLWALLSTLGLPERGLPLALALLAWGMLFLSYRLGSVAKSYGRPWYVSGLLVSVAALMLLFVVNATGFIMALTCLTVGLLYFADTVIRRQALEFVPAGLITAWGWLLLLDQLNLPAGAEIFGLAGLVSLYFFAGLWGERVKPDRFTTNFLAPLYVTGHMLSLTILCQIYVAVADYLLVGRVWSVSLNGWGAAAQLSLFTAYLLFAWHTFRKGWAQVAAWLLAAACTFTALIWLPAAAMAVIFALLAALFVGAERSVWALRQRRDVRNRKQAYIRLTWQLFHFPLLTTGWLLSAAAIGFSLVYNLAMLQPGTAEKWWAVLGLTLVCTLYAISARLFRQLRFVWLAAMLSMAPWTIMSSMVPGPNNGTESAIYGFSWALLAWALFVGHRLLHKTAYHQPVLITMRLLQAWCVIWASLTFVPVSWLQGGALAAIGLLYFADAVVNRRSLLLAPGGLVLSWGYFTIINQLQPAVDALSFAVSLLVAGYILTGLWAEGRRWPDFNRQYFGPLYLTGHFLTLGLLIQVYSRPVNELLYGPHWTTSMQLWGAATQVVLAVAYGLYGWFTYKERWGHLATWLAALGIGFAAVAFSSGRGSSAAKVALLAIAFILAERWLNWQRQRLLTNRFPFSSAKRKQEFIRLAWHLYRRPLLITGWVVSAVAIWLALIRNLLLLPGGEVQQAWSAVALLLVVGLYAISARLFHQARFLWLAGPLLFAPWTILTNLGWFTPYQPTPTQFAISWSLLAWGWLLCGVALDRRLLAGYALPLKLCSHMLMPLTLLWGAININTSCLTFGLAIGFYIFAALLTHRHGIETKDLLARLWKSRYLYPALGLIPIWALYLLAWGLPAAQVVHYGLLLLIFGPLGLITGQWLFRQASFPAEARYYALPAYVVGFTALTCGTLLVIGQPALLAMVLLFDTILLLIAAWLFRQEAWVYVASVLTPISLLLALHQTNIISGRYGWWLIGLVSIYWIVAWLLRRVKLASFGRAPIVTGFALIAFSLPFSSLDATGAIWGYGSAVVLYAILAFWFRRPPVLALASGLAIVPYAVVMVESPLAASYYGPALFPGAVIMLLLGWWLDGHFGAVKDFPWGWSQWQRWLPALYDRLTSWWAFSLYVVGFGLVLASPLFSRLNPVSLAITFGLMMPVFAWAIYRFRLRVWLVSTAVAGHFAMLFLIDALGWWILSSLAGGWLMFLPVTVIMTGVALVIDVWWDRKRYNDSKYRSRDWSFPLYIMLIVDVLVGQIVSFEASYTALAITIMHGSLIALLASRWLSNKLVVVTLSLGVFAAWQTLWIIEAPLLVWPVVLAGVGLGYGLAGYGLALIRSQMEDGFELRNWLAIWEVPLQRASVLCSFGTLVLVIGLGIEVIGWSLRAVMGLPFRQWVDVPTVQMVIRSLGLVGLLYVVISYTHRWLRFGYVAIALLLGSWMLQVFYVQQWDSLPYVQWYVMPLGLFLLGIALMEWQQENKHIARWLDYTAMVLMVGSLFLQTLFFGWEFALLLGTEGLLAMVWGSGRRLRRFLYVGMVAVVLATVGQLINSLWSVNQWMVFGLIGLSLVLLAIFVERKMEEIKSWRGILESWE